MSIATTVKQTVRSLAGCIALLLALWMPLTPAAFPAEFISADQTASAGTQLRKPILRIPACTRHTSGSPRTSTEITLAQSVERIAQPENRESLLDSIVIVQDGATIGSGTIISPQGYILTAAHLVPASRLVAVYLNSGEVQTGQAVYRNPAKDVAILKIAGPTPACLSLRERWLPPGSRVYSVGFSTAQGGQFMVEKAQVLGYRRTPENPQAIYLETGLDLLPGSSGGPLLDTSGQVVGIISWKAKRFWNAKNTRQAARSYGAVTTWLPAANQVGLMRGAY